MADELDIVVATTAFGMGVDKANVRYVLHLEPSDSLDSYYQEIGRAGRDGEPAAAVLFYRPKDVGARRFYAAGGVDEETITQVAEILAAMTEPLGADELEKLLDLSSSRVLTAVSRLQDVGAVSISSAGQVDPEGLTADRVAELSALAAELEDSRRAYDRSRLDMMRAYAEGRGCRRACVLSYFGEPVADHCGNCDNCRAAGRSDAARDSAMSRTSRGPVPGAGVEHSRWGRGTVQRVERDTVTVLFDSEGYRTLDLAAVRERGLLGPVD